MPIAPRGSRKAMRGSVNADGAGAKVFAGDGCSQERLSAPWPRFHGVDRADVYIIIHVRACCCGECALNPPPSRPIPHRRPSLAHAVPTHAHAAQMHARRPHDPFPAEELRPSPQRHAASPSVPLRAQKKRHRTVDVRCRMSRSTVVAVGHWGW